MHKNRFIVLVSSILGMLAFGCLPEKEVEIEIPPYDRQLVVECYMEVGKPFRLLVSESIGFFEPQDTPIIAGAEVVISHNGIHDTLPQGLFFDPEGLKIFNFASSEVVPADYTTQYSISVKYPDGRHVSGAAKIMPPVQLEPMTASFNADSNASVLVRWLDEPGQQNFYRLALFKGKVFDPNPDNENTQLLDFTLDDRIGDGEMFTVGTLFDYQSGDTIIAQLYHIDQPYWRYINSLDDAASSNGNPFAQPGVIRSTVSGGIGVFTGYLFTRDTLIIP